MDTELASVDQTLKALADPTRLRIVGLLWHGEICVCHIHESLGLSQPKVSRHLAYLRRSGLVETEKRGLWVYYRLGAPASLLARQLLEAACACTAQLETTQQDAARLVARTGCCLRSTCDCQGGAG